MLPTSNGPANFKDFQNCEKFDTQYGQEIVLNLNVSDNRSISISNSYKGNHKGLSLK